MFKWAKKTKVRLQIGVNIGALVASYVGKNCLDDLSYQDRGGLLQDMFNSVEDVYGKKIETYDDGNAVASDLAAAMFLLLAVRFEAKGNTLDHLTVVSGMATFVARRDLKPEISPSILATVTAYVGKHAHA
ncbi:hypothetical protein [Halioglobus sp. Uisw_031]|uniref:hypothetical protein n=1 Tax=Halioglobus sp. Uisw_031 TaxID=3230977 RepID=UPI0039E80312